MKAIKLFLVLLITQLFAMTALAQSEQHMQLVDNAMQGLLQKNHIPGAAVILYVDGNLYEQYYGYANLEKKEPVIRKTIFEIGSLSKIMTSLLLAQEVDWAKMQLADPVSKYVKGLPASFDKITLQDLATHTSGLPFNVPANVKTMDELKEYLQHVAVKPESQWRYSNVGIGLLGYALEASTERNYDDLYRRHVLNPLGMVNGVTVPKSLSKYIAQGYDRANNRVKLEEPGLFPAAYAVKASAADMQKFLSAAIGLKDTPPRVSYPMKLTQSMFFNKENEFQGLAWQVHAIRNSNDINALLQVTDDRLLNAVAIQKMYERPVYSGSVMADKTGTTDGFGAYIAVIPNKKSGIVILVNKHVSDKTIVKTAREILLRLTNLS